MQKQMSSAIDTANNEPINEYAQIIKIRLQRIQNELHPINIEYNKLNSPTLKILTNLSKCNECGKTISIGDYMVYTEVGLNKLGLSVSDVYKKSGYAGVIKDNFKHTTTKHKICLKCVDKKLKIARLTDKKFVEQ